MVVAYKEVSKPFSVTHKKTLSRHKKSRHFTQNFVLQWYSVIGLLQKQQYTRPNEKTKVKYIRNGKILDFHCNHNTNL